MELYLKLMHSLRQLTFYIKQVLFVVFKAGLGLGVLYILIMFALPFGQDIYEDYRKDSEVCARLDKEPLKDLLKNHYPPSKVQNVLNGEGIEYTAKRINLRSIKMERETFSIKGCQSVRIIFYTAEDNEYPYYIFPRAKDTGEATFGEYNNSAAIIYVAKFNGLDYIVGVAKAD